MAANSLQNESAPAKPLSFWDIGMELEDLDGHADELAKLIYIASGSDNLDEHVRGAMRALATLAEEMPRKLRDLSERVYAAGTAQRGANVAEFPARD